MNKKVRVGQKGGVVTITDRQYKGAGGEASIYVNGPMVFKLYHEPKKKIIPVQKMNELAAILNPQVVLPKEIIYDAQSGEPLGYTTKYIDNAEPLLKLFTKTFKDDNNIDPKMIADLVKQLQLVTGDIHAAHCLLVDFNELNELVNVTPHSLTPWFIDTDSYATPSYKATAIMDSVRDRRVTTYDSSGVMHYKPDEFSDWYSWGILTFWLYVGIHPFRGNHPKYRPKDKQKQMDDGISVFHQDVRVPPTVNNFNVIPKRHRDWYEGLFLKGDRSAPPLADSSVPMFVPAAIVTIKGTGQIDVMQMDAYSSNVISLSQFMGINYVVTQRFAYAGQRELLDCSWAKKTLIAPATDGTMVAALLKGTTVTFVELATGKNVGSISTAGDMFSRNGCIYTISANGKLIENSFTALGAKLVHRILEVENVSVYSTTMFEGGAIQDLLGKQHIVMPYAKGRCFSKHIPQLDKHRIVSCKSDKNITVVLGEHNGQYDRFILIFDKDYKTIDVRKVEDVAFDEINFAVTENGLCALLSSPTELELFVNSQKVEVLNDPPFDSSMKLFATPDGLFFINGNTIHQIKKK